MIAIVLLTVVGLLAAICLFRAATLTSMQVSVDPSTIEIDRDKAAEHLAQAVRFRTISYDPEDADAPSVDIEEFRKFHKFLEDTYPKVTKNLDRQIINELSLVYTWTGANTNLDPILLMDHLDVVPVEEGTEADWNYPPFEGEIAPDPDALMGKTYIWGRGTLDVKNNVIAIMEAMEYLIADGFVPQRTVYIAMGHDEEIGGHQGNEAIAKHFKDGGIRFAAVLDEGGFIVEGVIPGVDGYLASVGIGEKGYVSLALTSGGKGGHSSKPPRKMAIGDLAVAIQELKAHPFPAEFDGTVALMFKYITPHMPFVRKCVLGNSWLFKPVIERILSDEPLLDAMQRTTTAFTVLRAGGKVNVLPQEAEVVVNFRTTHGTSAGDVSTHVRRVISNPDIQISVLDGAREASPISNPNSPQFRILQETISSVFPESIVAPYLTVGGTDSRYYADISDQVFRFCPAMISSTTKDVDRIHGTDERISVDAFEKSVRFMAEYIMAMDSL